MLRRHGLDPSRVESPASAWRAFQAFLAVDIDGREPGICDRFAVSWGRHAWSNGLPTLAFVRRLAVDPAWSWRLSLDMVFQDRPDFAEVAELNTQSSGYYALPLTDEAVHEALWEIERYPALLSMWTSSPLWSVVSLGAEHPPSRDPDTFDAKQLAAYLDYRARYG